MAATLRAIIGASEQMVPPRNADKKKQQNDNCCNAMRCCHLLMHVLTHLETNLATLQSDLQTLVKRRRRLWRSAAARKAHS